MFAFVPPRGRASAPGMVEPDLSVPQVKMSQAIDLDTDLQSGRARDGAAGGRSGDACDGGRGGGVHLGERGVRLHRMNQKKKEECGKDGAE
jgi:hypothetical protein